MKVKKKMKQEASAKQKEGQYKMAKNSVEVSEDNQSYKRRKGQRQGMENGDRRRYKNR